MTETVAIVCADVSEPYRHDTIGPPIEGRSVVLRNPETGADAPPGEPGELVLAGVPGEDIFLEYLDDPAATGRSFVRRDGVTWFRTGDMVVRADGTDALRFVGRRDDVIKVSGENVSLTEIEATLAQAPGVLECAVLGRPDPVRDMVPVAYVVPRDPEHPPAVERAGRMVGAQPGGGRPAAGLAPDRGAAPDQRGQGAPVQALTR